MAQGGGSGGSGATTAAQDEMFLLEKVQARLLAAETDSSLSAEIHKFLPPCLLKLASGQEGVRKRVMELLVHINKRIKTNDNIQLPIETLLVQYQDPSATSFVINFTVIYIKMGFPRLPPERQSELIPPLLQSLEAKPGSHQDSLLAMVLPMLGDVKPPENEEKKKAFLGLSEKPEVRKLLLDYLMDYLLLPYGSHPSLSFTDENGEEIKPKVPAGMCESSWKRIAGETPIKAVDLEQTKAKVTKFLGMGLLEDMDIAMHLIVSSADTRHSVVSQAETEIRKFSGVFDWNDPTLVGQIYSLFLGTLTVKDKPAPKPEMKRMPANTRIRLRLMPYLLKSREAAMQFPPCIQVTFDLLFATTGNTNAKLKMMSITFVHEIIRNNTEARLLAIGPLLLNALNKIVSEEKDNAKLRGACYIAIGKLGLKVPELVNKDVTIIQTFFEAISTEDKDTQLSVQEAMSLMAPSFKKMEATNLTFLEALLATYIEKEEPQVRMVAIQYAGEVFPHTHVPSRYILLLGAGDAKDDVANAAKGHLYGAMNKLNQQGDHGARYQRPSELVKKEDILPDFLPMLQYVMEKAAIRVRTQQRHVIGDRTLAYHPAVYTEILNFLRVSMIHSSGVTPERDCLSLPQFAAPEVSQFLKFLIESKQEGKQAVFKLVEFTELLLGATQGPAQAQCMLQLIGCTSVYTAQRYATKMGWIKGLLDNTREDIRESLAQFYSLVIAEMDEKEFERTMADLTRSFKEKGLEMQHGIVLALGYSFGRRILKLRKTNAPEKKFREWGSFKTSSELLLAQLSNHHSLMLGGACSAVAEIGRCGPLPLADSGPEDEVKNKLGVVKKLLAMMKSAKNGMRVREKATMALGQICIGDPEFPHRRLVLEECLESAQEIKDLELHFTMGEAIVYAAIGPLSPAARDLWQVKEEDFKPDYGSHGTDHIEWVIDQLCNKYTMSTHPNVKQGSCLWLLALTKHGKHIKSVQDRMLLIQSSFMYLLGDANDLVQDAASKGLGLVYDSCSEEQQDKMVKNLLGTLMEGNRSVAKVSGETKIFEEGSMSKTPTGENLNTYKELCSLATDLNQPDLVYKFMHLANYNSMWNSRKGAAFGFSTIATKAGEQLEEHLHKIVPKLYRYQFDPTPKIQESMTSIWNALVPESTKTVDKYLPQIIEEIHTNLTSNQWRVRESCCMALHDLLRGRTLDDALDHVPGLWADIFRLMDDIKETVRTAANKAAGSLSRTSIRMCDIAQGAKSGQAAIKVVMPPLLEKGLASTVAEVRSIVLATIVKITRSAGEVLKPHLPLLIPALLEATSELESKEMNYLSVKLANDVSVQEKLDLARIQSAKSSPMMECVNFVLQYVDAPILEQLVPRIIELIKGNVGIGTKGTTAHLVTTLTHQCPLDLQQYTGKILAAFVSGLTDRNAAVRKTYAEAIGYLMKTAKDSSMEKLFVKLRTWYIEKDDDTSKWAVAYTLDAINKYNPDKLKSNATQAVPLTFLAMHEQPVKGENDGILEIWEEVWSDITPGTEGGIRIFLVEIMALLSSAIESTQWKMKAQAARAMGTIASKLGNSLPMKDQGRLLTILINALSGRTWDGKEAILTALADVCSHSPETVHCLMEDKVNGLSIEILMTCLLKECKKEKMSYKLVALSAVGRIMKEMKLEYFPALYEMGFPVIRMEMEEDEHGEMRPKQSEEELDDDKDERDRKLELRHAIYECLGNAWPTQASLQEKYFVEMLKSLYARVLSTTRKNQLCITKCLGEMIGKWKAQSASAELRSEVFVQVAKILSVVLVVPKSSQLRTQALSVLSTAIKLLVGCLDSQLVLVFRNEIAKSLEDVIRDVSSDAATKAMAREIRTALLAINDEASDPPEEKMEEE